MYYLSIAKQCLNGFGVRAIGKNGMSHMHLDDNSLLQSEVAFFNNSSVDYNKSERKV